jgi:hypothetical protein
MYAVVTAPYKDEDSAGYACAITDLDTEAAWRVTAATEKEALEEARVLLNKQSIYLYQCVSCGDDLNIPA